MTLCSKHYAQMDRYGEIKESPRYKPNELVVNGDITEIILCNIKGFEVARALIDTKYIDVISGYKWYLSTDNGYVISSSIDNNTLKLHRVITNAAKGTVVDHISHCKLDNRIENLRVCTNQENMFNYSINSRNSSGYKGVYKDKGKWVVRLSMNGINMYFGRFIKLDDAIEKRRDVEKKYHGNFAYKEDVR